MVLLVVEMLALVDRKMTNKEGRRIVMVKRKIRVVKRKIRVVTKIMVKQVCKLMHTVCTVAAPVLKDQPYWDVDEPIFILRG